MYPVPMCGATLRAKRDGRWVLVRIRCINATWVDRLTLGNCENGVVGMGSFTALRTAASTLEATGSRRKGTRDTCCELVTLGSESIWQCRKVIMQLRRWFARPTSCCRCLRYHTGASMSDGFISKADELAGVDLFRLSISKRRRIPKEDTVPGVLPCSGYRASKASR